MTDIVKITVYARGIKDSDAVDAVYKSFFPTYVPARTTLAVAALPMDALVQIDALVSHGEGTIPNAPQAGDLIKLTNNTPHAPISPFSTQTVAFSHYNHLSAQLPISVDTGELVTKDVKEQTTQCLTYIKAIVESIDHTVEDIVKVNIYLKDIADMDAVNEVYATFFPTGTPARTVVGVSNLLNNARVQIDAVVANAEGTPPTVSF